MNRKKTDSTSMTSCSHPSHIWISLTIHTASNNFVQLLRFLFYRRWKWWEHRTPITSHRHSLLPPYRIWQELFSRKGLTFWLEKPTSKQSSASCSVTYLTMSATACVTGTRWIAASRLNCSVMARCCWRFEAMMSITAVSDSPMLERFCCDL